MSKKILCVEDEPGLRADIADELRDAGYDVTEAGDGREALAVLETLTPDLVLCDITMPGMSGYDVLKEVRDRRPDLADVPFVFLTALAGRADVIAGKRAGADDYLTKPIDFDDMLATIGARLSQVERMREKAVGESEKARDAFMALVERSARVTFEVATEAFNRVALGMFLLDAERRLVFANQTGRALLDEQDGLLLSGGHLRGATPKETAQLKTLIDAALAAALGGDCQGQGEGGVALPRPSGARALVTLVCPLHRPDDAGPEHPAVVVFVSDPERKPRIPTDLLARLYGLTPAETRLAVALADGQRLDEIAETFGVARTTIAFHLRSLFRKTDTNRQAELVALFSGNPVTLGGGE